MISGYYEYGYNGYPDRIDSCWEKMKEIVSHYLRANGKRWQFKKN